MVKTLHIRIPQPISHGPMLPADLDEILAKIRSALEAGQIESAIGALTSLHPVDRAEAFLDLGEPEQKQLLDELDSQTTADLLEEIGDETAVGLVAEFNPRELAEVLDEMSPEGAADILGDMTAERAQSTLAEMEEAEEVSPLLKYRDDSAGGLMSPEYLALDAAMTADDVITHLRQEPPSSDAPYYLYVVGPRGELVGVVPLRELITASPSAPVSSIMRTDVMSVTVDMDQEEVANLITRYGLLLIPVVDGDGRLVGVVKNRDVVQVIEEEATEDLFRLAGVSDANLQVWSPLGNDIWRRLPWLYVNLGTAFLAASVVRFFESTIQQLAILAVFQGIIAGQGGNAGTQTLTLMVRGIALGEITFRHTSRALAREALIGVVNGTLVGAGVGVAAYLWIGNPWLGVIAGVAMVGNMVAAGLAGTVVPLGLKAIRLDPALASGVLVTTVTDCVGFGLFLYLATFSLDWLR